jgi:competence protein ComEC
LLAAACCFALGDALARSHQPTVLLFTSSALLSLLVLAALRQSLRIAIVPLAALWIAIGCWCAAAQPAPSTQQELVSYADGLSRQVRGRVVRGRDLAPLQKNANQDIESGWWPEKEEADEESSVVDALSVDIQVDSSKKSRRISREWCQSQAACE